MFVHLLAYKNIERIGRIFFKLQAYLGVPSINLWFMWRYLIEYAHNDLINDLSIFGIQNIIF